MKRRKITIVDLGEVTGYSRDQLHGLLKKLPLYAEYAGTERVAREFTRHDVYVLSVAVHLEQTHGLRRAAIAAVIAHIHAELRGHRPTSPTPLLHITINPLSATYLIEKYVEDEGIVVALAPLFRQVDDYLNGDYIRERPQSSFVLA